MTKKDRMIQAIKFYRKHPKKWISFASDWDTVETMCCLNNLRIVSLNSHGQARINSHNADLYLSVNDGE